jgi:hypothetical protein
MRVKFLCLLVLLTLAALPAWSAAPAASPSSTPQVTLADILAPVPAQPAAPRDLTLDLGLISSHRPLDKISCTPACTTLQQCRDFCGCLAANCKNTFGCSNRVCDCTPCP